MNYFATCHCGQVELALELPKALEEYRPRACACDFCTSRNLWYLSDPEGHLKVCSAKQLTQLRQGSEQALFWLCSSCNDLMTVSYAFDRQIRGAVNARLFEKQYKLMPALSVSPQNLNAKEKLNRWKNLWLTLEFFD